MLITNHDVIKEGDDRKDLGGSNEIHRISRYSSSNHDAMDVLLTLTEWNLQTITLPIQWSFACKTDCNMDLPIYEICMLKLWYIVAYSFCHGITNVDLSVCCPRCSKQLIYTIGLACHVRWLMPSSYTHCLVSSDNPTKPVAIKYMPTFDHVFVRQCRQVHSLWHQYTCWWIPGE